MAFCFNTQHLAHLSKMVVLKNGNLIDSWKWIIWDEAANTATLLKTVSSRLVMRWVLFNCFWNGEQTQFYEHHKIWGKMHCDKARNIEGKGWPWKTLHIARICWFSCYWYLPCAESQNKMSNVDSRCCLQEVLFSLWSEIQ